MRIRNKGNAYIEQIWLQVHEVEITVFARRTLFGWIVISIYLESCFYLGKTVQHEYSWVINCDENCTCYDGTVTCVPHCSDVMIPDNCTNPVLTKSRDSCCDTYECQEIGNQTCVFFYFCCLVSNWFIESQVTYMLI